MVRQKTEDTKVVGSSIALLRERFRQLQRIKLIREEQQREALRRGGQSAPGVDAEHQWKMADCSLSLGLASQGGHSPDVRENNLWPGVGAVPVSGGSNGLHHGSDHVDTSLHL